MTQSNTLLIISDGMSNIEYKTIKYSNYLKKNWNIISISYLDLINFSTFYHDENNTLASLPQLINSFLTKTISFSSNFKPETASWIFSGKELSEAE